MHKVMKQVHAYLTQAMADWRHACWPRKPSLEDSSRSAFTLIKVLPTQQQLLPSVVVDSLPATYQAINDSDVTAAYSVCTNASEVKLSTLRYVCGSGGCVPCGAASECLHGAAIAAVLL
jgi:hypothetical protein